MKIAITNAVLSNSGDAAIFEAILGSIDFAGVASPSDVIVFDANAKVTSKLYPEWTIFQQLTVSPPRKIARVRGRLQKVRLFLTRQIVAQPSRMHRLLSIPLLRRTAFAKAYRALTETDVVISSGGTYLVDHYNFDPRAVELRIAKDSGAQVILWTQSMGPFKSERARAAIAQIASVVDGVHFRDAKSAEAWDRISDGPDTKSTVPDVVFALTANTAQVKSSRPASGSASPKALISVREWSRGVDSDSVDIQPYEQMLRSGAQSLIDQGWSVEGLSTCQGVPSYAFDDSKTFQRIFRGLDVSVNSAFHRPQELLVEIAASDLVITTRMHLAILSLISRKPVIAIAYEFKTIELFNSLGLSDFVVRIEDASPEWLAARIRRIQDEPSVAVLPAETLAALREAALSPALTLKSSIDGADVVL